MGDDITVKLRRAHINQEIVIKDPSRFKVLNCGRRFGKSVVSEIIGVDTALDGLKVAYLTPTYKLARKFFKTYDERLPKRLVDSNKQDLIFNFITKGSIQFFTGEAIDSIRGYDFDLAIIDEASYFANLQEDWEQAIRPTLTDRKGKGLFLSTPRGKNDFFKFMLRDGQDRFPDWKTFKFTSYDNPHIPPEEIDAARLELPEATFEQEYLANPMENADNPFGYAHIKACIKAISTKPAVCFGIDLAKSYDYTVIIGLDEDGNVCHFERFRTDWADVMRRILLLPPVPMLIDATGVGDPIVEALQMSRDNIEGLKFTAQSKQELILGLVSAIQQNNIGYPDGFIVSELEVFEYMYTKTGVKYSAPSGLHDDTVCALALARKHWVIHGTPVKYHLL